MPDSARWLIANGKLEQAQIYLKKCAKINQREEFIHTLKAEVVFSRTESLALILDHFYFSDQTF